MNYINLNPIGTVHSSRELTDDDNWDAEPAYIQLSPAGFTPEALEGLCEFSHAEIVFYMHQVNPDKIESGARHPRNNTSWPRVGIFAQRGKNRPNQLGTTICRIIKVESTRLYLEGLDAVDGTPVLDIKPWVQEFGPRGEVKQPSWISELMKNYWR